ncbi:MAG: flagellar hook-associated protein FlgK [Firmicutes bacterium]|nr:flagellar hook-associated protein FlgK [Bacillota bacterium]
MGSVFGTYSIAYSGMVVSQAALAATSTNLANVNTTGASQVNVSNAEQNTVRSDGTSSGDGVGVASITRARDVLLDSAYRTQNAKSTYWSVKSGNLEYMDEILGEYETSSTTDDADTTTTTSGVQKTIDDFFSAWQTLSTDSTSESTRELVVSAAVDLVSTLSSIDEQLQQLQKDAVNGVKDGVDSLNDLASQVADLNDQITQAEAGGEEASYLRDQRDALLDQMSSLADIKVTETSAGLQVSLGGINLVNGDKTHTLAVEGDGSENNPLTVVWEDLNCDAAISSGSIKAYMEDADQTGCEAIAASDLPYDFTTGAASSISTLRQALNDLITTIATKVNSLTASGVDLNGDAGLALFTTVDSSQPLSIFNIQVNPELVSDSDKVVPSNGSADGDNSIANQICNLAGDTSCYRSGGLSLDITDFYKTVISWLGTTGETAVNNYDSQAALVEQVDTQRQSVSGISIDEEMANMIQFQNAYAASARVMSTIDGLLGDLMDAF